MVNVECPVTIYVMTITIYVTGHYFTSFKGQQRVKSPLSLIFVHSSFYFVDLQTYMSF